MAATTCEPAHVVREAQRVAEEVLAPRAAAVDRARRFPRQNFEELRARGLLGLMVPRHLGGYAVDAQEFVEVCEQLGKGCASTAMCFLMHSVAAAVLARCDGGPEQHRALLEAIARGKHLTTLAFSEPGSGSHFYAPSIIAERRGGEIRISGRKRFVTSGGHAESYLVLAKDSEPEAGLDVVLVERDRPGVLFQGEWDGLGMAANSSIEMVLQDVVVPAANLAGKPGDGVSLAFEVVAPYFLLGVSGVNIGIADAACDYAVQHARTRVHSHTGRALATVQAIQMMLADMRVAIDQACCLLRDAARRIDAGSEQALLAVLEAKVSACEAAAQVTALAMRVCGGQGYTRALPVERYFRDARAGIVMGPTNDVLREWIGRLMAGLPLFAEGA